MIIKWFVNKKLLIRDLIWNKRVLGILIFSIIATFFSSLDNWSSYRGLLRNYGYPLTYFRSSIDPNNSQFLTDVYKINLGIDFISLLLNVLIYFAVFASAYYAYQLVSSKK